MRKAYRLKKLGAGSDRFGDCECCSQPVASMYRIVGMKVYTKADGSEGLTHHQGIDRFGHKNCLASLTVQ